MANKSIIGSVLLEAGIISLNKNRCVCGCCKATGRAETLEIRHKKDCTAATAVKAFIENLHDDEHILPRVENPIELNVMLPYLSELSKEEYTVADAVATALFAAATERERDKLWKKVADFEHTCNDRPEIREHVIKKGLETNVDRVNFRNWLVFMKVYERKISLLEAQHYELEVEGNEMHDMFAHAFGV